MNQTDCTSAHDDAQLLFSFFSRKRVVGDFAGGELSSDAGLPLLRELDERLRLSRRLLRCLQDRRHPSYVEHEVGELFRQRVYQIACGYEDCNDADRLRADPALKLAVGRCPSSDPDLASQPTLSRWENSLTRRELWRLQEAVVEHWLDGFRRAPQEILLDVDATDDPTHGHQQLSFFHGFYEEHCYLPLLVFDGHSGQPVLAWLRPGNVHAARGVVGVLGRLQQKIQQRFPRARLTIRGDAGFMLPALYEFCEQHQIRYVIGLARNERLLALSARLRRQAERFSRQSQGTVQVWGEIRYQAESWERPRRVIVKAEHSPLGPNPRFLVTNDTEHSAEELYQFYCQRGECENRIKEMKQGIGMDRLSCHRFGANQFRLLLYLAAYLLLFHLRQHLAGTELAQAQVETLRLRLLKIGARVKETARCVWLHLASAYPWRALLVKLLARLRASPPPRSRPAPQRA